MSGLPDAQGAAEGSPSASSGPNWRLLLPLLLFGAMTVLLYSGLGKDTKLVPSPYLGKPAPEFSAPDLLTGATVSRTSLLGKPYLLNVWASWCISCQLEHPVLNAYSKQPGAIAIIGLNYKETDANSGKQWLARFGNPYTQIASDPDGRIGLDFGVYGAPETFFIDAKGFVRYKHVGELNAALIAEQVARLQESS